MSATDDFPAESTDPLDEHRAEPSLLDRLRGTGVGTEDPNIIGDAGPTDVAPGADASDTSWPTVTEDLPPEKETPSERLLPSDEDPAMPLHQAVQLEDDIDPRPATGDT